MRRRDLLISALGAPALAAAPRHKVLYFTRSAGFEHSVVKRTGGALSHSEKHLIEMGRRSGFEVECTKDGRVFDGSLDTYDAIVFYTTGDLAAPAKDGSAPMSPAGKQKLLDAISAGKGFVGIHAATDTFRSPGANVDPYIAMLGGEFLTHGEQQEASLLATSGFFYKNLGMPSEGLSFTDEWYACHKFAPDLHVLLVQETRYMKGAAYQRPDFPAAWARMHGRGRVFYTSLGHREDVWANPFFQTIVQGGLAWVTRRFDFDITPNIDKVTPGANHTTASPAPDARKTRSYNPDMEYRRLGRTGLMISAVSIGGHWKRIPYKPGSEEFKKNRREVMYACLEHGINYVDACSAGEVLAYAEAVRDRREEIYLGFDWTMARAPEIAGSLDKLKQGLDDGLRKSGLDYVDLWRITMREQTTRNSQREIETVMAALDWGKQTGKARFTGIATHHRPWIAEAVARYPQIEVVVTPYSAGSKEKPAGSMFEALRRSDVGMIGIKPFASGNLFASRGEPDSPTKAEDDERARLALRYVLASDVLTASIPGLITVDQVRNAAAAVRERRRLDIAEAARHERLAAGMWRRLPADYQWLRAWEWV